jgi:hypothetical protein
MPPADRPLEFGPLFARLDAVIAAGLGPELQAAEPQDGDLPASTKVALLGVVLILIFFFFSGVLGTGLIGAAMLTLTLLLIARIAAGRHCQALRRRAERLLAEAGAGPRPDLVAEATSLHTALNKASITHAGALRALEEERREAVFDDYLSRFRIDDLELTGLSRSRRRDLAAAGIITAADIKPTRLARAHSCSALAPDLLTWRRALAATFDGEAAEGAAGGAPEDALATLPAEDAAATLAVLDAVEQKLGRMEAEVTRMEAARAAPSPAVTSAIEAWRQAYAVAAPLFDVIGPGTFPALNPPLRVEPAPRPASPTVPEPLPQPSRRPLPRPARPVPYSRGEWVFIQVLLAFGFTVLVAIVVVAIIHQTAPPATPARVEPAARPAWQGRLSRDPQDFMTVRDRRHPNVEGFLFHCVAPGRLAVKAMKWGGPVLVRSGDEAAIALLDFADNFDAAEKLAAWLAAGRTLSVAIEGQWPAAFAAPAGPDMPSRERCEEAWRADARPGG